MAIQMYDKKGNSMIVDNQFVQQHLKMGWTYQKPAKVDEPKSVKTKSVHDEQQEEPAESTLSYEVEATAEVIKPNNKEN